MIRSIYQGNITGSVLEDRRKDILNDSSKAGSLAHSIINVYCGNMERLIKRCKNKGIEALAEALFPAVKESLENFKNTKLLPEWVCPLR